MKKIIFFLFSFTTAFALDVAQLKTEILAARSTIYGWCSEEKLLSFIDLTLEVKPEVCLEIGVYGGASLLPVAYTLKHLGGGGVVICIDSWDFIECIRGLDPNVHKASWKTWLSIPMDIVYDDFLQLIKKYKLEDQCIVYRMTSEKAASQIDPCIDILHIDGSHSERGSLLDVELYLPKVRSGGYIWLTDALWQERGEAVDFLLESCDVVKMVDNHTTILFKKR